MVKMLVFYASFKIDPIYLAKRPAQLARASRPVGVIWTDKVYCQFCTTARISVSIDHGVLGSMKETKPCGILRRGSSAIATVLHIRRLAVELDERRLTYV